MATSKKQACVGFDFCLAAVGMQSIRLRLQDVRLALAKCKEMIRGTVRHLHVKVTHEVTVQLPPDWKPRRERERERERHQSKKQSDI
jgi:hypothetical protein